MVKKTFSINLFWLMLLLIAGIVGLKAEFASAGPYRDSAHGNSIYGANRSAIDEQYTVFPTGNCAHCHEMHASIEGVEPAPADGPAANAVFAQSFNTSRTQNLYLNTDNFCFFCHDENSATGVKNQDYSTTFGGAASASGPQSILAAFNLISYHNLYDIWNFLMNDQNFGTWFAKRTNPCSGCHNSHLAKRNWDNTQPGFPLLSAISKPGASDDLWGETELMSGYFSYEAPFASPTTLEPAGVGEQDGGNTPDYVGFCTSCHNQTNALWSSSLVREIKKINWEETGLYQDKHGALIRNGTDLFRDPYETAAAAKSNFILSCLDCHEPHGSENIMLIRRRINGENLEAAITSTDTMGNACKRCHKDDLAAAAGTGEANRWEFVHHLSADAPYSEAVCTDCHTSVDGSSPIACGNCHGHGMDDNWAGANMTGRITF